MPRLTELEQARRAFLLVLCRRDTGSVARHYLEEKVQTIYRANNLQGIRGLLDLPGQKQFDIIMELMADA